MARNKIQYHCQDCGSIASKWSGQCSDCGAWNTLTEMVMVSSHSAQKTGGYAGQISQIRNLNEVATTDFPRILTQMPELDRVLGGGLVVGSVVLIGGDPGIGKSTLLLQSVATVSETQKVLYVTGEESLEQVSLRAQRLGVGSLPMPLLSETEVDKIIVTATHIKPKIMVIDSIQTVYTESLPGAPGVVSQVRESAQRLVQFSKQSGTALFLVGHVNKEGAIAGPRVLEHMVDTVLYFEGQSDNRYRLLRACKNRFGAVNELGIFAMSDKGLKGVINPSAIFLSKGIESGSGTGVMVTWEGTRPMLIEVQALVDESKLANPRRVTVGYDPNRLAMLLAVLNRHCGFFMHQQDVFLNMVGGVKIMETAADLSVLMAVISSYQNKKIDSKTIIFGEVGLGGEIRPVQAGIERIKEAQKHGFERALVPLANHPKKEVSGIEVKAVSTLKEAVDYLF
ncbi:DNA repair protein RadA [Candidatus Berkiella cookevillensis]|uniref:DNA repair protein RadA n=1 Tax=Candidatus Berkiella cookevillensis TaxID=437022 RepID=A0A0Q9YEN4_9GAMM|nr:DNA repair protein RadA [Candidatus Berkiella cookevillensis]MCS5709354.1 DNA repair protein RadA [Candidatus Berkiella cookevillensis]